MSGLASSPVWLVAVGVAVIAPWCARALEIAFERRLRRRTLDVLSGVGETPGEPSRATGSSGAGVDGETGSRPT